MSRNSRCFVCLGEAGPGVEMHPGHGAEICRQCVLRLASLHGWSPPPPEVAGRAVQEELRGALEGADLGAVELAGVELAHRARLLVRGPFSLRRLHDVERRMARILGREHNPRSAVELLAAPPRRRYPVSIETGAGPLYFLVAPPTPRPPAPVLQLSTVLGHLEEYRNYWRLLDDPPDRFYGLALEEMLTWDLPAALATLERVDPDHPTGRAARLLRALVLVLRGAPRDWTEAQKILTALETEASADLRPLVRYDLARLRLARGQTTKAAALLDGMEEFDAPRLRRGLTPALMSLGDCRTNLRQIASALADFQARRGALPERLADLQGGFLNVLPTCPVSLQPYRYRLLPDGSFKLRCPGVDSHRAAGAAHGHPVWDPLLGAVCHQADRPPGRRTRVPRSRRTWIPSGPLEAKAWRLRGGPPGGTRAVLWLSAARESAGDLPGAASALENLMAGPRPGLYLLHRTLLLIRMEEAREARECLGRCLEHTPFSAAGSPLGLLYRRFANAYASLRRMGAREGAPLLGGLFLLLCRAGLADRAARLQPPESWVAEGGERLLYMARIVGLLSERRQGGKTRLRKELSASGNPIRQALMMLYEGQAPQAVLCLEVALASMPALETELRLLLARAYREAGEPRAALAVLEGEPGPEERARYELERVRARKALGDPEARLDPRSRDFLDLPYWADFVEAVLQEPEAMHVPPELVEVRQHLANLDWPGPRAALARAALMASVDRRDEARDVLRALLDEHPRWAAAADLLASLLPPAGALEVCNRVLEQRPHHVRVRARRARLLRDLGRGEEADREVEALRDSRPDLADPLSLLDRPGPLDGPTAADLLPARMAALAEEWPA